MADNTDDDLNLSYQEAGDPAATQDARIATLPPEAQDKWHGLEDQDAEYRDASYAAYKRRQELANDNAKDKSLLDNLLRDEQRGLPLGAAGEKTKKQLERRIERRSKRIADMEATPIRFHGVRMDDFNEKLFKEARGKHWVTYVPDVKVPVGQESEALADVNEKIAAKFSEYQAVPKSARSVGEAIAIATASINKRAEEGNPQFAATLHQGRHVEWPTETHYSGGPHGLNMTYRDGVSLVAYLFRDELIARAEADIRARAEGRLSHTAIERKSELRRIEAELLELQRVEEVIFLACEDAGLNVTRSWPPGWHLDWKAVLQVKEAPKE